MFYSFFSRHCHRNSLTQLCTVHSLTSVKNSVTRGLKRWFSGGETLPHLAISGDIFGYHTGLGGWWLLGHLVGTGQGCCLNSLQCTGQPPPKRVVETHRSEDQATPLRQVCLHVLLANLPPTHLAVSEPQGEDEIPQSQVHGGVPRIFRELVELIQLHHVWPHTQGFAALVGLVERLEVPVHAWNWGEKQRSKSHRL